jgi:hypothetical protein
VHAAGNESQQYPPRAVIMVTCPSVAQGPKVPSGAIQMAKVWASALVLFWRQFVVEHSHSVLARSTASPARSRSGRAHPVWVIRAAAWVLEAGDLMAALMRISLAWVVGFMGLFSMFRGSRSGMRAAKEHKGHVGAEEHRAHEILADAGPHAALALVRCKDQQTRQTVAAAAAGSARDSWDGSLTDFLAALDPGSAHDWVRAAVGEPSRVSPGDVT